MTGLTSVPSAQIANKVIHSLSSGSFRAFPAVLRKVFHSPSSGEQGPVIGQDRPRGIVAGCAGDAAAGMAARAAMIETSYRRAVIGMAEHRPGREQLVQAQRAVEDVAPEQAELPLQVE